MKKEKLQFELQGLQSSIHYDKTATLAIQKGTTFHPWSFSQGMSVVYVPGRSKLWLRRWFNNSAQVLSSFRKQSCKWMAFWLNLFVALLLFGCGQLLTPLTLWGDSYTLERTWLQDSRHHSRLFTMSIRVFFFFFFFFFWMKMSLFVNNNKRDWCSKYKSIILGGKRTIEKIQPITETTKGKPGQHKYDFHSSLFG